jgi:hypothetical protein
MFKSGLQKDTINSRIGNPFGTDSPGVSSAAPVPNVSSSAGGSEPPQGASAPTSTEGSINSRIGNPFGKAVAKNINTGPADATSSGSHAIKSTEAGPSGSDDGPGEEGGWMDKTRHMMKDWMPGVHKNDPVVSGIHTVDSRSGPLENKDKANELQENPLAVVPRRKDYEPQPMPGQNHNPLNAHGMQTSQIVWGQGDVLKGLAMAMGGATQAGQPNPGAQSILGPRDERGCLAGEATQQMVRKTAEQGGQRNEIRASFASQGSYDQEKLGGGAGAPRGIGSGGYDPDAGND